MHHIGAWTDSKFQKLVYGMPDFFKYSKIMKVQLTGIYLPPVTMLRMVDATSMYKNNQIFPTLN